MKRSNAWEKPNKAQNAKAWKQRSSSNGKPHKPQPEPRADPDHHQLSSPIVLFFFFKRRNCARGKMIGRTLVLKYRASRPSMCSVNRSHNEPCARTADLDELKSRGVYSELCCHSSQKNDKPQSQPVQGSGTLWIRPSRWIFRLIPRSEIKIKNRILNKSYRGPRARRPVKKNSDSKIRWRGGDTWLHHVKIFFYVNSEISLWLWPT